MPFPSQIGKYIKDLPTPCLVVSKDAVETNCKNMLEKAQQMGVKLRGQTKTHKTIKGAILQTGGTNKGLVVSTLEEAELYAKNGFDDILYGYPLLEHHMQRNLALLEQLEEYHVMINNIESAKLLKKYDPPEGKKWSVYLKIDAGYPRAGVPAEKPELILEIGQFFVKNADRIEFQGLYAHCGNSYGVGSNPEDIQKSREDSIMKLNNVAKMLIQNGIPVKNQGTGSTPSFSQPINQNGYDSLTEIHPGNYVFNDMQQFSLGSCQADQIAARVLTRVLGRFPGKRNQIIIDAGFLALSEQGFQHLGGSYAKIKDHPNLRVLKMTQEIGFVEPFDRTQQIDFEKFPIGGTLELVQYHSCDTAARFQVYYVHDSNNRIVDEWYPTRCW